MKAKRSVVVCGNGHRFLLRNSDALYRKAKPRRWSKWKIHERRFLMAFFGRASADLCIFDCPKCAEEREARYQQRREKLQS